MSYKVFLNFGLISLSFSLVAVGVKVEHSQKSLLNQKVMISLEIMLTAAMSTIMKMGVKLEVEFR